MNEAKEDTVEEIDMNKIIACGVWRKLVGRCLAVLTADVVYPRPAVPT
jgi:hypothetical protein